LEQELIKVVKRVILKLPRDALLVKNTQDHPKTRKIVLLINAKGLEDQLGWNLFSLPEWIHP